MARRRRKEDELPDDDAPEFEAAESPDPDASDADVPSRRRRRRYRVPEASDSLRHDPESDEEFEDSSLKIPRPSESLRLDPLSDGDAAPRSETNDPDELNSPSSRMPVVLFVDSEGADQSTPDVDSHKLEKEPPPPAGESSDLLTLDLGETAPPHRPAKRPPPPRPSPPSDETDPGDQVDERHELRQRVRKLKRLGRKFKTERDRLLSRVETLVGRVDALEQKAGKAKARLGQAEDETRQAREVAQSAGRKAHRRLLAMLVGPPLVVALLAGLGLWWLASQHAVTLVGLKDDSAQELERRLQDERRRAEQQGREEATAQVRREAREELVAAVAAARSEERRAGEAVIEEARVAERSRGRDQAEAAAAQQRAMAEEQAKSARRQAREELAAEQQRSQIALEEAAARHDQELAEREAARADAADAAARVREEELAEQRRRLEDAHQAEVEALNERLEDLEAGSGMTAPAGDDPGAGVGDDPFAIFDDPDAFGSSESVADAGDTRDFLVRAWKWYREHLRTTVDYEVFAHLERGDQDDRNVRNQLTARLELDESLDAIDEDLAVLAIARVQVDDNDLSAGVQEGRDDGLRRPVLLMEEVFLSWRLGRFDVLAGQIIFGWGAADLFNPTDYINPVDLTDLLDTEKIGVPAAMISWAPGPVVLDVVLLPTLTPTRLGRAGKRFSFVPPGFPLPILAADRPPGTLENLAFAARLSGTLKGVDLSFSYFDGFNNVPNARLVPFGLGLAVEPVFDRIRAWGADFATTWNQFQIHGEGAVFQNEGDRADDFAQYVLGVEATFNNVIREHDVRVLVEYVGEVVLRDEGQAIGISEQLGRAFSSALGARLAYELSAFLKVEATGVLILDGADNGFTEVAVTWDATDNLTLTAGYDLLAGPSGTFFGQFEDDDRGFARVTLAF